MNTVAPARPVHGRVDGCTVHDADPVPLDARALSLAGLAELLHAQHLAISRTQLRERGVNRHLVSRRVAAGRWQPIGPNVVVLHNGALSGPQRLWVAVLHGGQGAALGGLTAATADGLTGFDEPTLHVVVPHGHFHDDLDHPELHIAVHESRRLTAADIHPARTPARTRLSRSIVDAASMAATDGRCRAILAAAVQQRLLRPDGLHLNAVSRPTLPRRALILETIADVAGGSHSLPELTYLTALRRAGLPEPTRQRVVESRDGRYYLDVDFDLYAVTVEINGAQHLALISKEYDDLRRTRLAIGGRLVVDIGSYTVRHDVELAVLVTADALLSRGWNPAPAVRRRLTRIAARRGYTFQRVAA
jgi:hypothetical protein